jgi:hypothetical protein
MRTILAIFVMIINGRCVLFAAHLELIEAR